MNAINEQFDRISRQIADFLTANPWALALVILALGVAIWYYRRRR